MSDSLFGDVDNTSEAQRMGLSQQQGYRYLDSLNGLPRGICAKTLTSANRGTFLRIGGQLVSSGSNQSRNGDAD